jgi:hypothetical protein
MTALHRSAAFRPGRALLFDDIYRANIDALPALDTCLWMKTGHPIFKRETVFHRAVEPAPFTGDTAIGHLQKSLLG